MAVVALGIYLDASYNALKMAWVLRLKKRLTRDPDTCSLTRRQKKYRIVEYAKVYLKLQYFFIYLNFLI